MLKNVDKCMTNVEDTDCTASYGVSANLVSSGGKSIVGYVKQLSKYLVMTGREGLIRLGKSLANTTCPLPKLSVFLLCDFHLIF